MTMTPEAEALREEVRARYAEAALAVTASGTGSCGSGSCCANPDEDALWGEALYDADPDVAHALLADLPLGDHVAAIQEGQRVQQPLRLRHQHAHAEGRQHLVKRERQVVDAQLFEVDSVARDELRAIDQQV